MSLSPLEPFDSPSSSSSSLKKPQENKKRPLAPPNSVIGVFGLSDDTTEEDLHSLFSPFGEIKKINMIYDRVTGRFKCFAFIYFDSISVASKALNEMNETELKGSIIRIDFSATARSPRQRYYDYPGEENSRYRYSEENDRRRYPEENYRAGREEYRSRGRDRQLPERYNQRPYRDYEPRYVPRDDDSRYSSKEEGQGYNRSHYRSEYTNRGASSSLGSEQHERYGRRSDDYPLKEDPNLHHDAVVHDYSREPNTRYSKPYSSSSRR